MEITFQESGGFLGVDRGCRIDTALLDPLEAQRLEALAAPLFSAPAPSAAGGARDGKTYRITASHQEKQISVRFSDPAIPPDLQPLVEYLMRLSRPQPL